MKRTRFRKTRKAHLTGIETEGDLAGEVVCPFIYVWKINNEGRRYKMVGRIPHGAAVWITSSGETPIDGIVYYVHQTGGGPKGWVTGRFVDFDQDPNDNDS